MLYQRHAFLLPGSSFRSHAHNLNTTCNKGTGKSHVLRLAMKHLESVFPRKVHIVAPTGVAACNIGGMFVRHDMSFLPRIFFLRWQINRHVVLLFAIMQVLQYTVFLVLDLVSRARNGCYNLINFCRARLSRQTLGIPTLKSRWQINRATFLGDGDKETLLRRVRSKRIPRRRWQEVHMCSPFLRL